MVSQKETKNKKMVEVDFTGKELLNGDIFDTTVENVAKEQNIFNKDKKYGPMSIILGEKELLDKVEKSLAEMKVGDEQVVSLKCKDAFGERNPDLVRVLPLKTFQEQKINPVPGLIINVGQMLGKVQSVSGGRVRVDFNHPLSGRDIEYTVKLLKEIKAGKEMCEKFFEKYYSQIPKVTKEIKDTNLYITMPEETLKGIEKVNATIAKLGKDLGITIEIKAAKKETKKEEKK